MTTTAFGQGYRRNITGEFSDIQVSVNNTPLGLFREPLVYDDEVYVPIKNLSQLLYLDTQYDEAKNTVKINTGGILEDASTRSFAANLLQRDYEINVLSRQLQQKDKAVEDRIGLPYRVINSDEEMEAYLKDYFGELHGISMNISFRNYRDSRYRLYITFPSRDREDFEGLSRRIIEEWMEDILFVVRELFDDRARIDGHMRDSSSSYRTYISFETDGDRLRFSSSYYYADDDRRRISINASKLVERLEKNLSSYNGVDFEYKVNTNRYDIDLLVYFDDKDFYDWSSSTRRNFLNRLEREVWGFDGRLDAYGKIIDSDKDEEVLRFHFMNRRVDFYDYEVRETSTASSTREIKLVEQNPVVRRNLNAWFNNIQLEIDGIPFRMLKEPFMLEDEIYMPMTDLGDALYWVYEYLPKENVLKIMDNNFHSRNSRLVGNRLLQGREQEREQLLTQIEIMQKQLERELDSSLPYRSILSVSRMESYLRDYFEIFEGIETYIRLTRSSGDNYRLRITYPIEDYAVFDGIRSSTIERWVDGMLDAIRELYDPNARISGSIRPEPLGNHDFTLITFEMERDRLTFDFEEHGNQTTTTQRVDARRLERELERYLRRYRGVNFRYEVVVNRRDVDLNITCTNDSFYRWDLYDKLEFIKEIKEEIYDLYDGITVNGRVVDTYLNDQVFRFSIEKGSIRSYDLLVDMEKHLNRHHKEFTAGGNTFSFTYRIWEKDANTFDVKLEGDFFQQESEWRNISDADGYPPEFEVFVEDALKVVADFWQVDVVGEAVDKAYSSILVKTVDY